MALWNGPAAHDEFVERTRQDAIEIALALDHDLVRPTYWRLNEKPAARVDEFTFRYESADGSWHTMRLDPATELYNTIAESPKPELQLEDLEEIAESLEQAVEKYQPTEEEFADLIYVLKRVGQEREVRAPGPGLAIPVNEPAWLEATLLRPDLVARYLDVQVARAKKVIPFITGLGAVMLFGGGDFASDKGPMYSPRIFHDLMLPRLQVLSDYCHRAGAYHFFGSDGNLWPVAEDLYGRSGIDRHYEVDRRAGMTAREIHRRYPNITMAGDIPSHTLHTGTRQAVVAETRACLEEARETGKVISGCSNMIVSETPDENVLAMLETIAKFR